ncbi:hypothetical protein [Arthrobacter sp. ZGTC412]|uniref:hypothetical protein n=1 Tax=Arthrobacter sp. ZGTC412 TaxID=2058900 RepID=UPI000CE43408|nr:hypothetical protein [Arthrobacter sp. ZGTC412]
MLSEGAPADQSPALRILARTGFVFMGLAYILINSFVLHIYRGQAEQSSAIGTIAPEPDGPFLLGAGWRPAPGWPSGGSAMP